MEKLTKYVLRNITNNDVNIGDLRYTIPARKARDLLSKTAKLNYDSVMKSKQSGSICKRLGKSLVEVVDIVEPQPPKKTISKEAIINFPSKSKSSIIIDFNEITEDALILNEEDEIIKQLEQTYEEEVSVPLVSKKDEE